jgi:hypothetical protein
VRTTADIIRDLREAHAAAFAAAADKALVGERVAEDLARLKDYEQLIELSRSSHRTNLTAAIIVGAMCFLIAGLIWAVRVPSTKVHLSIVTDSVSFRLADQWAWTGIWRFQDAPFRLDELSEIELPAEFSLQPKLTGRAWLDVENGQVTLSALELGAHGSLSLLRNASSATEFLMLDSSLRGQAQISGMPVISAGDAPSRSIVSMSSNLDTPVIASFYDAGRPSIPARIRVTPKEKVVWRNIAVERLSFMREATNTRALPLFVSGITSGTVTLSDTAETIPLREKDQLYLESPSGVIQEIEISPDALRVSFEGYAKRISKGVTGLEENLTPTWLSYIYNQARLGFFWGTVAFLWGALWSGRQLLFK